MEGKTSTKGRNASRSKKGCTNCLIRKIKCDERRPACFKCSKAGIQCSWDQILRHAMQRERRVGKGATNTVPTVACSQDLTPSDRLSLNSPASTDAGFAPFQSPQQHVEHDSPPSSGGSRTEVHGYSPDDFGVNIRSVQSTACPNPTTLAVQRPLSTLHIPCSNSILLSAQDRTLLDYFRSSSIVYILGKSYHWSNFRHLCENRASEDSMIMHAVLAFSASDSYRLRHDVRTDQPSTDLVRDPGLEHYNLALRKLSAAIDKLHHSTSSLESTIGLLCLLVMYEWKFGTSVKSLEMHIEGVRLYVGTHLCRKLGLARQKEEYSDDNSGDASSEFTPFCAQMLLWIAYIDASCVRGLWTFRFMDFLNNTSCRKLRLDRLFTFARSSYRWMYGDDYPTEEVRDDLENYRPLELIHHDYVFRYRICRAAVSQGMGDEAVMESAQGIWNDLVAFGERYGDLFAEKVQEAYSGRRVLRTLREGCAGYYSNILLHRILLWPDRPPSKAHRSALIKLLELTSASYRQDPKNLSFGWAWYLFVAAIGSDDSIHREWLHEKLTKLRCMGTPFVWVQAALESLGVSQQHLQINLNDIIQLFQLS